MDDHLDPSLVAVPFYVIAMLWEARVLRRQTAEGARVAGYERNDTLASLGTGLVSVLTVGVINFGVVLLASRLYDHRLVTPSGPWPWVIAMIAWDFAYYWVHRAEHGVRILWAIHVSHHSSEHYNLSTALRQPWLPLLSLVAFPPIALLGIPPWMIMTAGGLNLIYQFWIHTEAVGRLPRWSSRPQRFHPRPST